MSLSEDFDKSKHPNLMRWAVTIGLLILWSAISQTLQKYVATASLVGSVLATFGSLALLFVILFLILKVWARKGNNRKRSSFIGMLTIGVLGSLALIIAFSTFALSRSSSQTVATTNPVDSASACSLDKATFVSEVNGLRSSLGLRSLTEDPSLDNVATTRVNDMLANKYYGHVNPATKVDVQPLILQMTRYSHYAEVIDGPLSSAQAYSNFKNSPEHYAIITNANITHIGVDSAYAPGRIQTYDEKGSPVSGQYGYDSCIVVAEVTF